MFNVIINYRVKPNKGGSQLVFASVCESKNISTSPFAALAPARRAVI